MGGMMRMLVLVLRCAVHTVAALPARTVAGHQTRWYPVRDAAREPRIGRPPWCPCPRGGIAAS